MISSVTKLNAMFSGLLISIFCVHCTKIPTEIQGDKLTWKFTRKFCSCPNGQYFNDTIWPIDNQMDITSASIIYHRNNPGPSTFHYYINESLLSIQQFKTEQLFDENNLGPGIYYPGMPDFSNYILYSDNPSDANSTFWMAEWLQEGEQPLNARVFSIDFPYRQEHNFTLNDTIYYNFFSNETK